ncbi:hypothetical protein [uncultured Mediterranean phage uvMED]|nr:hypothetical protein [uncultured Mediterranean phage uvMED]
MAVLNKKIREGIIVELTPDEVQFCQIYGRMRTVVSRGNNIVDTKMGNHDGAEGDVMGFMGEFAFAKQFNTFPDLGLSPKSGTPDGLLKGERYDVKSSNIENARLLCTLKINPDVDFYVLAIVKSPTVEIKGWAWKSELVSDATKINLGHGEGYGLEQNQLRQFKEQKNER